MAKYMLLIFGDPAQWDAMTPELASMLPEARASHSGVEIRPVVDHR